MTEAPAWLPPRWYAPELPQLRVDGSMEHVGCSYAIEPGFRPMLLDVRVPAGEGPFPAVVWLHGGGYAMGDRRRLPDPVRLGGLFDGIVAAGIAVIAVDYRLGREAVFPAAVHDVKAALRWIARFAEQLRVDPARVGIWGESAGAHLAGMVAATEGDADFEGELGVRGSSLALRAFVSWYGAMDLPTIVRPAMTPEMEATLGGNVPEVMRFPPEYFNLGPERYLDMELRRLASPTTHATSEFPTSLFVHGVADRMVPLQQSQVMIDRLHALGVAVTFEQIDGADHVWMGASDADVKHVIDVTTKFLQRTL